MEQMTIRKTAILIDGGYYRVRARTLWGNVSPADRAQEVFDYCRLHITQPTEPRDLYRIFYYDCPPMTRTFTHPLTKATVDYSKMTGTTWSNDFFRHLVEKRKVALRMGELAESTAHYVLKDNTMSALLAGSKSLSSLTEDDFRIEVKQKGVDMRIGLDVASLAHNKLVTQIILIAGDSDFLPVVKMARKNGIDVLLDPMKQFPKRSMQEHVDGIESYTDLMYPTSSSGTTVPTT